MRRIDELRAKALLELERLDKVSASEWGTDPFFKNEGAYQRFRAQMGLTAGCRTSLKENGKRSSCNSVGEIAKELGLSGVYRLPRTIDLFKAEKEVKYIVQKGRALCKASGKRSFRCPEALGLARRFLSREILTDIARYLETPRPFIYSPQVLYFSKEGNESLTAKDLSNAAFLYHRDIDNICFVKLFICILSSDGGMHHYVKGSHAIRDNDFRIIDSEAIANSRFDEPLNARSEYETHLSTGRFTDESVGRLYGRENILEIPVSQGCAWIEDTYGLHKGSEPESGERLLMSVTIGRHAYRYC